MLQNNNVTYAPVQCGSNNDEENISFIPTGVQASSNSGNHHHMYSIDGTEDTSTTFISNEHEHEHENFTSMTAQSHNQRGNEIEIIAAVAVPNTIRPPKVTTSTHPSVIFAKKLAILLCGLFLAFISFLDSWIFFQMKLWHRLSFSIAAIFWAISTISLVCGSCLGAYKGKWRYLAPGIVTYHVAAFTVDLVM